MSPLIIYCRTLKTVGRVFCHLKAELGEDAWVDQEHNVDNLIIGMFHSHTLTQNKSRVLSSFTGEGNCRVVVATTALGMGLNFPNISHVVMYGVPEDVEAMLQQVGRAGRDGSQSHAIVYTIKDYTRADEAVGSLINQSSVSCFRKALYSHFEKNVAIVEPGHFCCTSCHSLCTCNAGGCAVPAPKYELLQEISTPVKCRNVTPEEQGLLRDLLEKYRKSLLLENTQLYTMKTACTGFGTDLINLVLEHSNEIFDFTYIMQNLPVFNKQHAQEILKIIHEVFGDFEYSVSVMPQDSFLLPDVDYTGYFDEEDGEFDHVLTPHSSSVSGLSVLISSD